MHFMSGGSESIYHVPVEVCMCFNKHDIEQQLQQVCNVVEKLLGQIHSETQCIESVSFGVIILVKVNMLALCDII